MTLDGGRLTYSAENCSIAGTLEIVGERWSLLVMREAFFGVTRFDDFHQALGCARNLLSARLSTLVEHGLLERSSYQVPGQRRRPEYQLTRKGAELLPALLALMQWGDRWAGDPDGPPVVIEHSGCGARVRPALMCEAGHAELSALEVEPVAGPGARRIGS